MTALSSQARTLPTRRELARLIAVFGALVIVMTVTLGLDLSPGLALKSGDLA